MSRRRMYGTAFVVLISTCALGTLGAEASAQTVNRVTTCGQVITRSSVLARDLACPGDGVVIAANGVTLQLDGHTLRSTTGTGDGVVLASAAAGGGPVVGVTVGGPGTITGFVHGVGRRDYVSATGVVLTVRQVSFTGNQWLAGEGTGSAVYDGVTVNGPGVFPRYGGGGARITRSSITTTGSLYALDGGGLTIEHSTIVGGWGFGNTRVELIGNRLRGVDITCSDAWLGVRDNELVDSSVRFSRLCDGSVVERNRFSRTGAVPSGTAVFVNDLTFSAAETRITGNTIAGYAYGVALSGVTDHMVITGNTLRGNGTGIAQLTAGCATCIRSGGTVSSNLLVDSTGDGLRLTHGDWRIGSNVARRNRGLGINAVGADLAVVDAGRNVATGNAAPQCVGVVCATTART